MTSFKIELNSLLRELNSPLIDCSLISDKNKLSILNYLCGELLSSRMNYANRKSGTNSSMAISMNESQTAKDLKTILITLGMGKPPNNISSKILFKKIKDKLIERFSQLNYTIEDSLLLPHGLSLSLQQWNNLQTINEELFKDYSLRREMLLMRCDCTVKSFNWKSDKTNDKSKSKSVDENQINETYQKGRQLLDKNPNVSLAEALAARESDCDSLVNTIISKIHANCVIELPETKEKANQGLQQRLQLHKYIIGSVPDRGGRPDEQPKPPKESFSQQQQQRDNPQRGRGRGGGGFGGGRGAAASSGGSGYQTQNQNRIQGAGWAQNSGGNRYSNNSGFDNQMQSRGGYREQQNYNNYQSGHQRYSGRDDYQQNSAYQQSPHEWTSNYQQQYAPQSNQYYNQQQYNTYSDQSYYSSNSRQQSQQQSDYNQYNDQRDRNYNKDRGGYRRGGRR
jgi:hypothetical protein